MKKNLLAREAKKCIVSALFFVKASFKNKKGRRYAVLSRLHFALGAGHSLRQAVFSSLCNRQGTQMKKTDTVPEILFTRAVITKSELDFFSYAYRQGFSRETICAFFENAHLQRMFRKKCVAVAVPLGILLAMVILMALLISLFVMPKLEPLAQELGIKMPIALRILSALRTSMVYHTGSLIAFFVIVVLGLREIILLLKRSQSLKRSLFRVFFMKRLLQDYYFLRWAHLYVVASKFKMPRVSKMMLSVSVAMGHSFASTVAEIQTSGDFKKLVRANIFFMRQDIVDELSRLPLC